MIRGSQEDPEAEGAEQDPVVPVGRLGELVAQLTGEDPRDSAEAARQRLGLAPEADDPLAVVARAIVDLRESRHALRVTRYVEHRIDGTSAEQSSR